MSEIDYDTVKIIVENNMREAGFQGNFENGWKETIVVDNTAYQQQFNLQGLRDIITKSIVDALTDAKATGSVSTGNIQGVPVVAKDQSTINITKQQGLPSKNAAREGDDVTLTATTPNTALFLAWTVAVAASLSSLGAPTPVTFTSLDGKITSGSSSVKIGD